MFPVIQMLVSNVYPENVWVKVGKRASAVIGITEAEFFTGVGTSFVQFVTNYGFDKLTGSIARNYRDFVQVNMTRDCSLMASHKYGGGGVPHFCDTMYDI